MHSEIDLVYDQGNLYHLRYMAGSNIKQNQVQAHEKRKGALLGVNTPVNARF